MEMDFLLFLQNLHSPISDFFFSHITLLGNAGIFWIICCLLMLCTKKYRKCGILFMLSLVTCFILGNLCLKNMVARERPCWVNTQIALLIQNPKDFSFPSGHSMHGFVGALSIWYANKKWGIAAFILAGLIAFSRMYLFVHYPTDIAAGILLGLAVTFFLHKFVGKRLFKEKETKREQEGIHYADV